MDIELRNTFNEYEQKLDGYTNLLMYQYINLCIKAEPASLLSMTIISDYGMEPIEDAAMVSYGEDDYSLLILPKTNDRVMPIAESIKREHPEFKVQFYDCETNEEAKVPDDLENDKRLYLKFTMPEVDKNRYDLLNDSTNAFYHQAEANLAKTKGEYAPNLAELSKKEKDSDDWVKEIDNLYDSKKDSIDKQREDKLEDIKDAYNKYLSEHNGEPSATVETDPNAVEFGSRKEEDNKQNDSVGKSLKL